MKTSINTLLVALYGVAILLGGCNAIHADSDKRNLPDVDLVGVKNCSPPCWNDITPGQTSTDDAIIAMRQLKEEKGGDLSINNYGITWREKAFKKVYTIELQNDFVELIQLSIDRTSLEQVVSLFGEPDYWISGVDKGGGGCFILIYYPNKGLTFTVNLKNEKSITKDASVTYSYFVPSTDIRNEIGIIHGEEWIDEFMTKIHEWKGYGETIP